MITRIVINIFKIIYFLLVSLPSGLIIVLFIEIAFFFKYIFNKESKQSLHDTGKKAFSEND